MCHSILARLTSFTSPSTSHNSLPFPRLCRLSVERQFGRFSCESTGSILSLSELLSAASIIIPRTQHINAEDSS
jgi:hypothetical protein